MRGPRGSGPTWPTPVKKAAAVSEHLSIGLAADPTSPAKARAELRSLLDDECIDGQCAVAAVVVGELVANAVRHGREPIEFDLTLDRPSLRVEVSDGDARLDRVTVGTADRNGRSARGLQLVAALASAWGVTARGARKTVWAELLVS